MKTYSVILASITETVVYCAFDGIVAESHTIAAEFALNAMAQPRLWRIENVERSKQNVE